MARRKLSRKGRDAPCDVMLTERHDGRNVYLIEFWLDGPGNQCGHADHRQEPAARSGGGRFHVVDRCLEHPQARTFAGPLGQRIAKAGSRRIPVVRLRDLRPVRHTPLPSRSTQKEVRWQKTPAAPRHQTSGGALAGRPPEGRPPSDPRRALPRWRRHARRQDDPSRSCRARPGPRREERRTRHEVPSRNRRREDRFPRPRADQWSGQSGPAQPGDTPSSIRRGTAERRDQSRRG